MSSLSDAAGGGGRPSLIRFPECRRRAVDVDVSAFKGILLLTAGCASNQRAATFYGRQLCLPPTNDGLPSILFYLGPSMHRAASIKTKRNQVETSCRNMDEFKKSLGASVGKGGFMAVGGPVAVLWGRVFAGGRDGKRADSWR